jgi:amino acid adenylation domain-containing protein
VVSTVAADLGLSCFYGALLTGGTLHLVDRETATDPQAFARYLSQHPVDVVKLVPSHLTLLAGHGDLAAVLPRRLLILGGEGCPWSLVDAVRDLRPDLGVHTHYGPTEATMMSLICDVDEVDQAARTRTALVPLGRPLPGVAGLVVDRAGRPLPAGVPGELLLGGPGVTRGYAGRPDLTAERFTAHPAGGAGRWYRTGDRVRLRRDGSVEFLGRCDDQIKVRGYRVEPGEVTAALRALPEVADAVVLPEGQAHERRLVCWIVPAPGCTPQPDAIRARLRDSLADYLVPATVTVLERIPLTPNGKVDRAALPRAPKPADTRLSGAQLPDMALIAPSTPTERAVAAAWADILAVERIGAGDDFFALGGHSFAATRMVARLAQVTGCALPVRVVFERPILRDLAAELDRRTTRTDITGAVPRRDDPSAPVRLSPAQERLWFLWRLRPDSDNYNTSLALRLHGPLDTDALSAAVRDLGARHQVLCTTVVEGDAGPLAVPASPDAIPVKVADVEADRAVDAVHAETTRPFALDAEPPLRALILRSSATEHTLVLTVHHIAVDAWSWTTIQDDLAALYEARRGVGTAPEAPAVQYADVAEWQRARQDLGAEDEHLQWWTERLAGLPPRLELPTDRVRGPHTGWAGATEPLALPQELAVRLRKFATESGCTPFMVLLTAWQALLARIAGTDDVPVGIPVSGRLLPGTERMVGCFANTLVLRGNLSDDPTVGEALRRTRAQVLDAFDHAGVPFERVVERLQPDRDVDSTPLFQAMLNVIDLPRATARFAGLTAQEMDTRRSTAQFDLSLALVDDGVGFTGALTYRTGLFDQATARRWTGWYTALLDAMPAAPDEPVLALDPLSAEERAALRAASTGAPLPSDRSATVVSAVLDQARRRPAATAVRARDGAVSYAELAEWSGRVAAALVAHGVRPGEPVGVCLSRDRLLPGALLAVLRARAAYVPFDPAHPGDRLTQLADDAGVRVVLARQETRPAAQAVPGVTVIDVDRLAAPGEPRSLPEPDPHDTAYVLYTSGSTGRPKGVQVTHANLAAFVAAMSASPGMAQDDVTLGVVPFSFDVFGYELWVTLARGAQLALADRDTTMDGHALAEWIRHTRATVATATPTTLRLLMAADWAGRAGLRVISIGEILDVALAGSLAPRIGELWNAYGPTETTIYSTITRVPEPMGDQAVPIGGPIAGTRVHVVDARGRLALPGTVGELWIAGAGVARGYLGRPDLTAERFVTGPSGERCYRTGDLVRWRRRTLEYLGRTDHQVKVRGQRIELGEIEAVLRSHPNVADAVVTVTGPAGEQDLVGYVVPRAPSSESFAGHLRAKLPSYMVPSRWVVLEALPTTANGKVDRAALPAPRENKRATRAPVSLMEQLVVKTWAEVLRVDDIGLEDDFFALGGHSLAATRVAARLREALGWPVPVRALFDRPVLADFAVHLEETMLDHLSAESDGASA